MKSGKTNTPVKNHPHPEGNPSHNSTTAPPRGGGLTSDSSHAEMFVGQDRSHSICGWTLGVSSADVSRARKRKAGWYKYVGEQEG